MCRFADFLAVSDPGVVQRQLRQSKPGKVSDDRDCQSVDGLHGVAVSLI
jgi:hypothetical protein